MRSSAPNFALHWTPGLVVVWTKLKGRVVAVASELRCWASVAFIQEKGPTTSSWFPAGLVLDLEELLGRRVEIVTEKALNPYLRDRVLCEAVPL